MNSNYSDGDNYAYTEGEGSVDPTDEEAAQLRLKHGLATLKAATSVFLAATYSDEQRARQPAPLKRRETKADKKRKRERKRKRKTKAAGRRAARRK